MKIVRNPIFMFVLGLIVAGSVVYALNYNASDIGYKNGNVEDAIDELYGKVKPVYNGATTFTPSSSTQTIGTEQKIVESDITINPIPSTYKNLTTNTTVSSNNLLSGETAYNSNGELVTGSYVPGPSDMTFKLCTHSWASNALSGTNIDLSEYNYSKINVERVSYSNGGTIDYYFSDSSYNRISLTLNTEYNLTNSQIKYLYVTGSINSSYGFYCAIVHLYN